MPVDSGLPGAHYPDTRGAHFPPNHFGLARDHETDDGILAALSPEKRDGKQNPDATELATQGQSIAAICSTER